MISKAQLITLLAFICLSSSCRRNGENCIYLIPKNFEGNLIIIFEQKDGVDTEYEGKNRLYKIDTTGVLRTKFKPNYGVQLYYYYYIDSVGNREALTYMLASNNLDSSDAVFCFNAETGNDFDKINSVDRHFEMLTVARSSNIDSIGNMRSLFMWKILPGQ